MGEILTVLDIETVSFNKTFRGYSPEEVEEFLEKVGESIQVYSEKVKALEARITNMEDQLKEYQEIKTSLQDALVLAQKSAEERVSNAENRAEVILAEAEAKSHKIIIDAKENADSYKRDIERLRQVRYQFVAEFKGLVSKFGSMLNALETPQLREEQREEKPEGKPEENFEEQVR
ncbi:MAG: DivIVA domain-containing protein [Thermovirgaceae bacterium]